MYQHYITVKNIFIGPLHCRMTAKPILFFGGDRGGGSRCRPMPFNLGPKAAPPGPPCLRVDLG